MNESNRPMVLVGVLLVLLLGLTGFSALRFAEARSQAVAASEELARYRSVALQIEALREAGEVATVGGDTAAREQAIAEQIAGAGQRAGLSGEAWFDDLIHKSPRRVGDTPYMRKDAVLYAKELTLVQLAALLHELTYDSPLIAEVIDLRTPSRTPGDRWDADVTLTYLIYEPATTP